MNEYFDIRKIINNPKNKNVIVYIIVAERNVGKTYSTTGYLHERVLEGEEFIYMRRYSEKELDVAKGDVFSRFTRAEGAIACDGREYFLLDEEGNKQRRCGHAVSLSSLPKGVEFPNVTTILFDEFSITDNRRYLKGEFDLFANFFETVARRRENIKVIMLGNSKTFYNPYTIGWNINLTDGQKRWRSPDGLVYYEKVENMEGRLAHANTLTGRLFSGTSYDDWAGSNSFSDDSGVNIKKKGKDAKYWCTIKKDGISFTIWYSQNEMYVSDSKGENRAIYNFDKASISIGESLFMKSANQIARIKTYASVGLLFYESEKIRKQFTPVMNAMLGY